MSRKNFIIVSSHNKRFCRKIGIRAKALIAPLVYLLFSAISILLEFVQKLNRKGLKVQTGGPNGRVCVIAYADIGVSIGDINVYAVFFQLRIAVYLPTGDYGIADSVFDTAQNQVHIV